MNINIGNFLGSLILPFFVYTVLKCQPSSNFESYFLLVQLSPGGQSVDLNFLPSNFWFPPKSISSPCTHIEILLLGYSALCIFWLQSGSSLKWHLPWGCNPSHPALSSLPTEAANNSWLPNIPREGPSVGSKLASNKAPVSQTPV